MSKVPRDVAGGFAESSLKHYLELQECKKQNAVMRGALEGIKANSAPKAVSLRPRARIRALYEIACRALAETS